MRKNNQIFIHISAISACLLWATAFAGIKAGLKYASPLDFAGLRFILAGLMLLPFCGGLSSSFKSIMSNYKTILSLSLFQTILLYGSFFWGMELVPGALGAIVVGSTPLITAITAHFLMPDDKLNPQKMTFILFGLLGIVIISISRHPLTSAGLKELGGIGLLIFGNIASAIGNVIVAKDKKVENPVLLNSVQMLIGGIFLLFISIPFEGLPEFIFPLPFYLILLWLSFISALAFSIWFFLLKKTTIRVSGLNMWKFIIPVFGAMLSWILISSEKPDIYQMLGMVFVAISIFLFFVNKTKNDKIFNF
ncbi:MAG: DMT family transporter [Candidatus Margulisbacteria bacterium]|nr:DMT family transporter [Candidatus Margulisiibacteriota bacterium]